MKKISPKELSTKLSKNKVTILDVRSSESYERGKLNHENAESIHIPKNNIFALEVLDASVKLPFSHDQEIIVTCTTGNSATRCTKILSDKGYNVSLLDGGMTAWEKEQDTSK